MINKLLQKIGAITCNISLLLNSFLPYFAAIPAYAVDTAPIAYGSASHQLYFSLDTANYTAYQLFYKTDVKIDSVSGSKLPEYLYLGTCSDGTCLPQSFQSAILKIKTNSGFYFYYFTLNNSQLQIVSEGNSAQLDLTDDEFNLLEGITRTPTSVPTPEITVTPTSVPKVEQICLENNQVITDSTLSDWNRDDSAALSETKEKVRLGVKYNFPQENKVSVTFKCLPKDESLRTTLKIQQIKASELKLPDNTNVSEYAYDITTGMADGTFEYDVTLPKNSDQIAEVSYIEKTLEQAKTNVTTDEIKSIDNLEQQVDTVKATGVDHFTIYIVKTYDDAELNIPKSSYNQGETVFIKGISIGYPTLRIILFDNNGSVIKTCPEGSLWSTTCSYVLPVDASVGTWKVDLERKDISGNWETGDTINFEVVSQNCSTTCPIKTFSTSRLVCPSGYRLYESKCYKLFREPENPTTESFGPVSIVYTKSNDRNKCHRPTAVSLGVDEWARNDFNSQLNEWEDYSLDAPEGYYLLEGVCYSKTGVCVDPNASNYDSELSSIEIADNNTCIYPPAEDCPITCDYPGSSDVIPDGLGGYKTCPSTAACYTPICGNGIIDAIIDDECDDSNTINGDGCSSKCKIEKGWDCAEEPSICVDNGKKITICHASGLSGTTKFNTLELSENAVYSPGNGGHFNEDGSPKAGHESDYLGACTAEDLCGNNVLDRGEECDGTEGVIAGKFCAQKTCKLIPIYDGPDACPTGTVRSATPVITKEISSTDADGESFSLTPGKKYLFEASGTFIPTEADGYKSDAGYTLINGSLSSQYGISGSGNDYAAHALLSDFGTGTVGVVNWGTYNPSHTYSKYLSFPDTSSNIQFVIGDRYADWFDTQYQNQAGMNDNSDSLTLKVYECRSNIDVTVCKKDQAGKPLSGWKVGLSQPIGFDTAIPVGNGGGVSTTLGAGDYVVFASGTYRYGSSAMIADAGYSFRPIGIPMGTGGWVNGDLLSPAGALEFKLSGGNITETNINWGAYNPLHQYSAYLSGFAGNLNLSVWDNNYGDNSNNGNFNASIDKQMFASGFTDADGCNTFTDVPFGDYHVFEVAQDHYVYQSTSVGSDIQTNYPATVSVGGETPIITLTNAYVSYCGDNNVDRGEQCDDGNTVNTDACTNSCKTAKCGDGFVLTGTEQCDDGNTTNNDACTNFCKLPICGDGIKNQDSEQCDGTDGVTTGQNFCAPKTCKLIPIYDGNHTCSPSTSPVKIGNTYTISSQSPSGIGVSFSGGKEYLLKVSGTYSYDKNNSSKFADPAYGTSNNWSSVRPDVGIWGTSRGVTSILGNLGSGMGVIEWDNDNLVDADHVYEKIFSPSSDVNAQFLISDWYGDWYSQYQNQSAMSDNNGSLQLEVYECQSYGSINVVKFNDLNGNGTKDEGEGNLSGWTINLTGQTSVVTDSNGLAAFNKINSGDYVLSETIQAGWIQTNITCDRDEIIDNDNSHQISLTAGQTINCKIGNRQLGNVTVYKFNDLNGNGTKDEGENNLSGWTINLTGQTSVSTNEGGQANFSNLVPGNYDLSENLDSQPGWTQTNIYCDDNNGPGVKITKDGEAYGHHGACEGWNGCTNAATCALWACEINGYDNLVSYGADKPCTEFSDCNLFNSRTSVDMDWRIHCGVRGVTDIVCSNGSVSDDSEERGYVSGNQVTVSPGQNKTCYIGNQRLPPRALISKWNNANSSGQASGSSVEYKIKIKILDNNVSNFKVTDLLSNGFIYRPGTYSVVSSRLGDITDSIGEPQYHSPGVWDLEDLQAGDELELSYLADISSDQQPGTYGDLAYALGDAAYDDSVEVLATSEPIGYVDENFSGTEVIVTKNTQNTVSAGVEREEVRQEGQVLGASTELPSTGSSTSWLIISTLMSLLGFALIKKSKKILTVLLFAAFFIIPKNAEAISNLSLRVEQPKTPTNLNDVNLNFVALDILSRPVTIKCYKKYSTDVDFTQFGSDISLTAGGNANNCSLSSILTTEGSYQLKVVALAGADSIESILSLDYKTSGPGTPGDYRKEHPNNCDYTIHFKTADDSGKTVKVEVYRSDTTSFNLDSGSFITAVNLGSNQEHDLTNSVPDCSKNYYYVLRAFDNAGNGSGTTGDSVVKVISTTTTTTTTSSTNTGAIPVTNATIAPEASDAETITAVPTLTTEEGSVLGTQNKAPTFIQKYWLPLVLALIAGIAIIRYVFVKRKSSY